MIGQKNDALDMEFVREESAVSLVDWLVSNNIVVLLTISNDTL